MEKEKIQKLISAALRARESAYCPYSNFAVGAAILAGNGGVHTGFNIENSAYTVCVCAERVALYAAIAGESVKQFIAIAVTGGKAGSPPDKIITPCGVCRQALAEFCGPEFLIICAKTEEEYKIYKLGDLMPEGFTL
jgi:cytidine deaminase